MNLSQDSDNKFIVDHNTLSYLFGLKFLPLAENHPDISSLDLVFTALKLSVLVLFDKLPSEDSTQTLKLDILINKFAGEIHDVRLTKLDKDFENWLPTVYQAERFRSNQFNYNTPLKDIYLDPSKSAISSIYNFMVISLESLLETEMYPLSSNSDPSELDLQTNFNILDIMVSFHIISCTFAQTEWCDLAITKDLMKYFETQKGYTNTLQKVLAIIGTGLFLPNISNEETSESVKEKLLSIVTGKGEDNLYDIVASFAVLASYNNEALRENLEEVRLDERVVGYLDADALELYQNQ